MDTALLLFAIVIIQSAVLVWLIIRLLNLTRVNSQLKSKPDEWFEYPGGDLIKNAAEKADQIVSQAEMEAVKMASEKRAETVVFEREFQQKLDQTLNNSITEFTSSLQAAKQKHDQFILQVEKQVVNWQNTSQEDMRTRINSLLFEFEQHLTDFFSQAEQKSLDAINLEIKSARQLIDSYKSQQLGIIDENIVAVLERTLSLVLREKLTLKDQLDLVYEALEKAKIEKFLV